MNQRKIIYLRFRALRLGKISHFYYNIIESSFNRLVIFLYASLEELKNRFDTALNQGTTGFGLT